MSHLPATYKHASELASTKSMPPIEVLGPAMLKRELSEAPQEQADIGSCPYSTPATAPDSTKLYRPRSKSIVLSCLERDVLRPDCCTSERTNKQYSKGISKN